MSEPSEKVANEALIAMGEEISSLRTDLTKAKVLLQRALPWLASDPEHHPDELSGLVKDVRTFLREEQ